MLEKGKPSGFRVQRFATRAEMAEAAAADIATHLRSLLAADQDVRAMFAAAPSQAMMLDRLVQQPGIAWGRVSAFHMDEYIGLPADHPAGFANWLARHFWDRIPLAERYPIVPGADPLASAEAYAASLAAAPIDFICLGIGVNGHVAFNDPPVADFDDPVGVKLVELDRQCREQQVADECFARLALVPETALTVTVPALMAGRRLFVVVPGRLKREAVRRTLHGPISTSCPASILRTHSDCTLYLDAESAPET